jgi:uncharacterized protein YciI
MTAPNDPLAGVKPKTRYVIFHTPGRAWNAELSVMEQKGVGEHFQYLQAAFSSGKIQMAGPFLTGSGGGMIVMNAAAEEANARALVAGDPGVTSGLIDAELRAWAITLG